MKKVTVFLLLVLTASLFGETNEVFTVKYLGDEIYENIEFAASQKFGNVTAADQYIQDQCYYVIELIKSNVEMEGKIIAMVRSSLDDPDYYDSLFSVPRDWEAAYFELQKIQKGETSL